MNVREELEAIRDTHGGVLRPEDIVEYARDEETELHSRFEWDDEKAGHEYRLWQARQIVRVTVIYEEHIQETVRCYVSLADDREKKGGGYRALVDVMSDAELRSKLLQQAWDDFMGWKRKYNQLQELAPIFEAAEKAKGSIE